MGKKYALLIGTSRFDDRGLKTLHAPKEDVNRLQDVLEDPSLAGFDHVEICINSDIARVRTETLNLFADRANDDLVLFYYSGHGLVDQKGRLCFSLPATDSEEPIAASLEASFVRDRMDDSNSTRQVIILDCCHSGAFKGNSELIAKNANSPLITAQTLDPEGRGSFVLTASTASQSSFEKDGKSIYTKLLTEGIQTGSAAPDKDKITIADLHHYLSKKVKEHGTPMQPQFWAENQTDPMIISKNPNIIKPIENEIIIGLESSDANARFVAVHSLEKYLRSGTSKQITEATALLEQRQSDPKEIKMVLDLVETVLNTKPFVPEQVEQAEEPTIPSVQSDLLITAQLPSNHNTTATTDSNNSIDRTSNGNNPKPKKKGRLFLAFQSAILFMVPCISIDQIYKIYRYYYSEAINDVHFSAISAGIAWLLFCSIILGYETWRRGVAPNKVLASNWIFITLFVTIAYLSVDKINLPFSFITNDIENTFFLFCAFSSALVISGWLAFHGPKNTRLLIILLILGVIFSMFFSFLLPANDLDEIFLRIIPIVGIMTFLVFSFSDVAQLKSPKTEIKSLIERWNNGDQPHE